MPESPRIRWSPWHDPMKGHVQHEEFEDEEDEDFCHAGCTFDVDNANDGRLFGGRAPTRANLLSTHFSLWIGETNFNVTNRIRHAINRVDGVESLDIITRYRFRLGIARLYRPKEVKQAVGDVVTPLAGRSASPLQILRDSMARAYPHWAILLLPGGKLVAAGGATPEEVGAQNLLEQKLAESVLCSWTKE